MPRGYILNKKTKQTSMLVATLFFLLSLPFVIYGLFDRTFDTRGKAFDRLELSDTNPCIISLPNVNPYSLEVGKSVRVQIDAKFTNSGIKSLELMDSTGARIYSEEFKDSPMQIGTSFIFTPKASGTVDLLGMVKKIDSSSAGCKISSPYDIKGIRAVANNSSPEFTSQPSTSKPSQDIKTGTQYEYVLTAKDAEKDRINFFYSFTPKAEWLKAITVSDGSNGDLTVTFRGTTDTPGSYLAHVVIHDGYSSNVRTQSWVISVSPKENDIPVVKILDPLNAIRIDSGKTFKASWSVSDLNHIPNYQVFMAKNPADEGSWVKIGDPLAYNTNATEVSTTGLPSGTYKLVVKATDNQTPPKTGVGVSQEIVVSRLSDNTPTSDDQVVLSEAQVTNMSPTSTESISNSRVTIKGTIIASENSEIKEPSIQFKVDGINVSQEMKINKISKGEYTLIYQPEEDLKDGVHKGEITFQDSNNKSASKSWEFTINSKENTDGEVYRIFGKEISKRTLFIIGIGFLLLLVAVAVPILISLIWGRDRTKETTTYNTRNIPKTNYTDDIYIPPTTDYTLKEKVETVTTPEEDTWGKYNAPTPEIIQEEVKVKEDLPSHTTVEIKETKPTVNVEPVQPPTINHTSEEVDIEIKPEEEKFEPMVYKQEPKEEIKLEPQQPTQDNIPEPDAPDPATFQRIAELIQQQTGNNDSETQ